MNEIIKTDGCWSAKHEERDPHKCSDNRDTRMVALNSYYGYPCTPNDLPSIYSHWKFELADELYESELCLCGHSINSLYLIKSMKDPTIRIKLGSECIKRVKDSIGHLIGVDICELCSEPKSTKYQFCGGPTCARCPHGTMRYREGSGKKGPYYGYFCGSADPDNKCRPKFLATCLDPVPRVPFVCEHGPRKHIIPKSKPDLIIYFCQSTDDNDRCLPLFFNK